MKNFKRFLTLSVFFLVAFSMNAQEYGLASYYDDSFQGRKTAYGDTYDKNKFTAAHKKHPKGTKLKVTRLDSKKSVEVTVNDKGPYIKGRVVDLSRAAAERLGLIQDGIAEVKVEVVGKGSSSVAKKSESKPKSYDDTSSSRIATNDLDEEEDDEPVKKKSSSTSSKKSSSTSKAKLTEKSGSTAKKKSDLTKKTSRAKLVGKDYTQYGLYKIVLERPTSKGYGVQVASLSNYENVLRQVADLQAKYFDNILISVEKGDDKPIYKVILGSFEDEDAATNYRKSLKKKYKIDGFVLSLDEIEY
jgi:rare lipoprotein A